MNYIDISWPISNEMTTYKEKKDVQITARKTFQRDNYRESHVSMGLHSGTHIDAPSHFLKDGESSDFIFLNQFNGVCQLIDCTSVVGKITAEDLKKVTITADILLFKTKNSLLADTAMFDPEFIYIDESAANYLVSTYPTLKAVGIDYLGIERNQPTHPTHRTFFDAGVVIIEGLRLQHAQAQLYQLFCLPLSITFVEALPARAVLVPLNDAIVF